MLRIGVCEDHEPIRRTLARALRQAGHDVVLAHDGREALALFAADPAIDVIVMDIGLPDADGRDVVLALKARGQGAPVLFLTALDALQDKLQGFAAGADDYVVKPFDLPEVIARLEVLAARGRRAASATGGIRLDPATHAVRIDGGAETRLTPTEYRMLAAIAARPGEVVRRRAVVAAAWPDGAIVSENTVDSFVRRIRAKLASIDAPVRIETVRGVGFRVG